MIAYRITPHPKPRVGDVIAVVMAVTNPTRESLPLSCNSFLGMITFFTTALTMTALNALFIRMMILQMSTLNSLKVNDTNMANPTCFWCWTHDRHIRHHINPKKCSYEARHL